MSEQAKWYVVHTYSGYENKVAETIMTVAENRRLTDFVTDVRIPKEKVIEVNEQGEEKEVDRKLFPGYVLVKMILTDDSWYVVRNTRGVTGFVGPGGKAVPLTDKEIAHFGIESENEAEPKTAMNFSVSVGDSVRISDGTMEGFVGTVKAIHNDTFTADVSVSWFGRETIAEVELSKLAVVEEE
ncbi:MAG: transcription termination/antitermination factor NusG [Oscillospiraceae bacterium]|nr:transcription termination/antitermination factor NusG [Oscillospiraceae bacterium]